MDKLLDDVKTLFLDVYKAELEKTNVAAAKYAFDPYFEEELRRLDQSTDGEATAEAPQLEKQEKKLVLEDGDTGGPPPPEAPQLVKTQPKAAQRNGDSFQSTPVQSPDTSRPTTPLPGIAGHILAEKTQGGGRGSRRARKAANATPTSTTASSGDEARRPKSSRTTTAKKGRVWGADGMADEADDTHLDYSTMSTEADGGLSSVSATPQAISQESWGTKTKQGQFVLKDLDDEVTNILRDAEFKKSEGSTATGVTGGAFGAISGYFKNIVGGKTLTKQDLDKPLKAMEEHLIKKNVSREAAVRLCQGVEVEMVGKKTGSFESIESALKPALETSLRRILTPKTSMDLLQQIDSIAKPSSRQSPRPYVISVVGVNGVGKSTNLSKICFFLLQNNYRVLVVACDTFRSGAVEQLGVHVRNLKELTQREKLGQVDLFQKGYGKDAANVARDAVNYGAAEGYDVILIDTAGRAHTNAQLMSSLEKFADFSKPDLILNVIEALVGNDSVGQAQNFNKAFGKNRRLDGFVVSKCDTVGDQIGTIISTISATGIPVFFLGVGQHYGDLRTLNVPWAVRLLMS